MFPVLFIIVMLLLPTIGLVAMEGDAGGLSLFVLPFALLSVAFLLFGFFRGLLPPAVRFTIFPHQRDTVSEFLRYLSQCLRMGVPLNEAVAQRLPDSPFWFSRRIGRVLQRLEAGETFAGACRRERAFFTKGDIVVLEAGETAGALPEACEFVATMVESTGVPNIRLTLLFELSAVFAIWSWGLVFITPRFKDIYDQLGGELPFLTQLLIDASWLLSHRLPLLLILLLIAAGPIVYVVKRTRFMPALGCAFPYLRQMYWSPVISRFSYALGLLLQGAVPISDAMSAAIDASASRRIWVRKAQIVRRIEQGQPISQALSEVDWIPPGFLWLLGAAERSGTVDRALLELADGYARSHKSNATALSTMMFLGLLIGTGIFSGICVLALYLPLFNIPKLVGMG